jgi:iron complex outermembrane receptor protein
MRLRNASRGMLKRVITFARIVTPAIVPVLGAMPAGAAPAQALEPPPVLDEIVVVAQKRAENAQAVPMSIATLSPDRLRNAGVTSVDRLGATVPGLTVMNISGAISPRIRGLGASNIMAGNDPAVATYVDGVYRAYSGDLAFDLHDVAQINVLKGPQGTLFGRNATGGVLQIETREPAHDFAAEAATGLDRYLTSRSRAFIGGAIADELLASLSAQYAGQDRGWGKNIATGDDVHRIGHAFNVRGKLRYDIGANTRAKLSVDHLDRSDTMASNFKPYPGYSILSPVAQPASDWDIASFIRGVKTYRSTGAALTIEHDLDFARLTSITAWRDTHTFVRSNPSATSIPTQYFAYPEDSRQWTQEVQLVSNDDDRLTWVAGAFYLHNQNTLNDFNIYLYLPLSTAFSHYRTQSESTVESPAFYAQGTYRVTPETRVTFGGRYTWQSSDLHGQQFGTRTADGTITVVTPQPVPDSMRYRAPAWRVAVDHDFAPSVLGYASYNRGFKSGGFNLRDPANPSFRPEKVDAFEIGLKSEFQSRMRLNAALFDYEYQNIQVSKFTTVQVVQNGAEARIYGAEGEVTWIAADALQVQAGVQWLHARFESFPNPQFTIPRPGNEGAIITSGNATGNRLPFSPEFSTTLGIDYTIQTAPGALRFNLTHSYSSGYYGEADNRLFQRAYHLLNASMQLASANGRWGARLYADNLLNEAIAGQLSSLTVGYVVDYPSPPRLLGIDVHYRW